MPKIRNVLLHQVLEGVDHSLHHQRRAAVPVAPLVVDQAEFLSAHEKFGAFFDSCDFKDPETVLFQRNPGIGVELIGKGLLWVEASALPPHPRFRLERLMA